MTRPHLAQPSGAPSNPARAVAGHLAAAVVLGILADIGLDLGEDTAVLFTIATPWVLIAFSGGRASAPRWSAVSGAATLLTGLAAYYLWLHAGLGVSASVLTGSGFNAVTWVVVGAFVGGAAGAVGGLTRSRRTGLAAAAWSGAVAVPLVDAVLQLAYGSGSVLVVMVALGAVALFMVGWARRGGTPWWALAIVLPVATLVLWQVELLILQQAFGRLTWV